MKKHKTLIYIIIKCLIILLLCFIQIIIVGAFINKIEITTGIISASGAATIYGENNFEVLPIKIINHFIVSSIMILSLFIMYDFLYLILDKKTKLKYKIIAIIIVLLLSIFFTGPGYFIWVKGAIISFFLKSLFCFLIAFIILLLMIKFIRGKIKK
jgi:hypothetical protein